MASVEAELAARQARQGSRVLGLGDADAAALGMDTQPPEFYDEEADERNEAWVQKMRR